MEMLPNINATIRTFATSLRLEDYTCYVQFGASGKAFNTIKVNIVMTEETSIDGKREHGILIDE